MLELINVSLKTRVKILDKTNYYFNSNTIYGLVAPNGSGKTTLFRAISGLYPIKQGSIKYEGKSLDNQKEKMFYLESIDWLDHHLSGKDYLFFVKGAWNSLLSMDQIIQQFNLSEFIDVPIRKYSSGMKQRLLIALYFMSDAELWLMDEITNALDEESRLEFFALLRLACQKEKIIIISSHYQSELEKICDRVLLLFDQKLQEVSS